MITVQGAEFHVLSNHNSDRHLLLKISLVCPFLGCIHCSVFVFSVTTSYSYTRPAELHDRWIISSLTKEIKRKWRNM